jgi:hypothetical protein
MQQNKTLLRFVEASEIFKDPPVFLDIFKRMEQIMTSVPF